MSVMNSFRAIGHNAVSKPDVSETDSVDITDPEDGHRGTNRNIEFWLNTDARGLRNTPKLPSGLLTSSCMKKLKKILINFV